MVGEDVRVDEVKDGMTGGDQVIFEERKSWLDGRAILRTTSKVLRYRICKRAPLTEAVCVAVGEGTDNAVDLICWDISIFSIALDMGGRLKWLCHGGVCVR